MNIEYFSKYLEYDKNGLKAKRKEYLNKFINSFENNNEKISWTIDYLSNFDFNKNIRFDLFKEIIFPVLLDGYNNKNIKYMIWLAKIIKNISYDKEVAKKIGYISGLGIIKKCYELDQNNIEVNDLYIELMVRGIIYSLHEWPIGILNGNTFIDKNECKIILKKEIPILKKLDRNKKYNEIIIEYENKLKEYIIK